MADEKKSIFDLADKFGVVSPFGDWVNTDFKQASTNNPKIVSISVVRSDKQAVITNPKSNKIPIYILVTAKIEGEENGIVTISCDGGATPDGNIQIINKNRDTNGILRYEVTRVFYISVDKNAFQPYTYTTSVKITSGSKILANKEQKFTVDSKGKITEVGTETESKIISNGDRVSIKDLKPSSKVYLFLKEVEGLGYNVERNADNEIVRVFAYDDGGEMGKGNATIGYGHLIDRKPFNASISSHAKWKDGITLDEADKLLYEDVEKKAKVLITGLGSTTNTSGIKVPLLQREYDALVICVFNGGYGDTLETTINKGAVKLSKEEIFKAFLARRYSGKTEIRGLIKRRAMEADIFVNDDWMPYPSEKFKDGNAYIEAYQKFLKTGILPFIILFILSFLYSCNQNRSKEPEKTTTNPSVNINHLPNARKDITFKEYQFSELLFDENDALLMEMDTVLYFSDNKNLFEVDIKKEAIKITCKSWKEIPENSVKFRSEGIQKNGFIYIKNKSAETYEMEYKIILNKGLFFWDDNHWYLVNSGDS